MARKRINRQQTIFDHMAGEPKIDNAMETAFAEPGLFTVEHKGCGEIVLTTEKGTQIVANTMYVLLFDDDPATGPTAWGRP